MNAVVLIGIQGSGKSSFYKERYFATHVHISLDQIKTRHRERRLIEACIETQQPFVVDNTNPTTADRCRYIDAARAAGYVIEAFYFRSKVDECLVRNAERERVVPEVAILATASKLQRPSVHEGFDEVHYVRLTKTGFEVSRWSDEV